MILPALSVWTLYWINYYSGRIDRTLLYQLSDTQVWPLLFTNIEESCHHSCPFNLETITHPAISRVLTENMRIWKICFNCVWIRLEWLLTRTRKAMFILVGIDANEIVHHAYRICWEIKVSVRKASLHQEQRTAAESFDTSQPAVWPTIVHSAPLTLFWASHKSMAPSWMNYCALNFK